MSHLKARATRGKSERRLASRLRWKIHLVRLLYRGGWERKDVLELTECATIWKYRRDGSISPLG